MEHPVQTTGATSNVNRRKFSFGSISLTGKLKHPHHGHSHTDGLAF